MARDRSVSIMAPTVGSTGLLPITDDSVRDLAGLPSGHPTRVPASRNTDVYQALGRTLFGAAKTRALRMAPAASTAAAVTSRSSSASSAWSLRTSCSPQTGELNLWWVIAVSMRNWASAELKPSSSQSVRSIVVSCLHPVMPLDGPG